MFKDPMVDYSQAFVKSFNLNMDVEMATVFIQKEIREAIQRHCDALVEEKLGALIREKAADALNCFSLAECIGEAVERRIEEVLRND